MIVVKNRKPEEVICIVCEKPYTRLHKNTVCCSDACREERKRELQNTKYRNGKVTSSYKKKEPKERTCIVCGESFITSHASKKTCSKECAKERKWETKINPVKKKMKISSKFLVRGKIHYEGLMT